MGDYTFSNTQFGSAIEEALKGLHKTGDRYKPIQVNPGEHGLAISLSSPEQLIPKLRPVVTPTTKSQLAPEVSPLPENRPFTLLSDEDINKLVELESGPRGSYTALNKGSGAYGRYQFIPSTAKKYADRLGFVGDEWKKPENQDAMFKAFTTDNLRDLKNRGLPTDLFHVYGAHQQGSSGLSNILSGKITPRLEKNMRSNLPSSYRGLKGLDLRDAWVSYWKNRVYS